MVEATVGIVYTNRGTVEATVSIIYMPIRIVEASLVVHSMRP